MNSDRRDHVVKSFDADLARLNQDVAGMGDLAARQLDDALAALGRGDAAAAGRVIDGDDALDAQERRVNEAVLRLLALRQPMARDLRAVLAALRLANDIERIGDHAVNVARRAASAAAVTAGLPTAGLLSMGRLAHQMLCDAVQAYRLRDAAAAHEVWQRDDELDALYLTLFRELLTYMMEDPRTITRCTELLFVAKDLERIGDYTTNVAEDVWFIVHGTALAGPRGLLPGAPAGQRE